MSDVIIVGRDRDGLAEGLTAAGLEVETVPEDARGADLETAGIGSAAVLLLTAADQASLVPVARDQSDRVVIVLYAGDGFPDFASAQADIAVDRGLIGPDDLVDAIVDRVHQDA